MLLKLEGPDQFSRYSSWGSLASQGQQTNIIRLPLRWCSGFLGKLDPWPRFHHAYHSTLGQDLLNHNVMQHLPPSEPKCWDFNDPSQRGHLSDWEILLRDDTVQFLWDFGGMWQLHRYDKWIVSKINKWVCPRIAFTNYLGSQASGDQDKGDHFKVRDALSKTNWNCTLPKGQRKEPSTLSISEQNFLQCIY